MSLERTTSFGSLLLSSSLLALGACGDDSAPGGSGASGSSTGDATVAMTTTMDSVDSSAGPDDTTTANPTTTGVDTTSGEETGPPPSELDAFRFTEMYVRDPHFFVSQLGGLLCIDVTDMVPGGGQSINQQFNAAISGDDPMMPDGNYDLSLLLLFNPLDQADAASGAVNFANGTCAVEPTECDLLEGTSLFPTTYLVMQEGTCLEPVPEHLSNQNYNPQPGTTTGPCFAGAAASVEINTGDFALPLTDAEIAAQFGEDPADNLIQGTLHGFLSIADAEAIELPPEIQDQTGAMNLAQLLPGGNGNCANHDDTDGEGWWLYVDFSATRVPWVGPE